MNRDLIRRVGPAVAAVAAVCMLSSQAAFAQYKMKVVVSAKDGFNGGTYQVGDLNNKGQFSFNIVGSEKDSGGGGETTYLFDGSAVIRLQPQESPKLPDGSTLTSASHWTPHGINDVAVVWIADTDKSPHAVVRYDIASKAYTIIANDQTVVEGGKLTSGGVALEGRMVADVNNKDQVVWSEGLTPADGSDAADAVFMFDPATSKHTTIARKGTALPGGKTVAGALFPNINDNGDVVFMANTADNENYGIYQYSGGNISVICAPGTQVDGVTIAQAKLPRNSNVAVVFRGETTSSGGAAPVADDTGFFMFRDGKLSKIAVPGDTLGSAKMVSTEGNRRAIAVNNSGLIAFKATLEGDASGIFLFQDGKVTPLLTSGQTVEAAGAVSSVVQGIGDNSGYHMGINDLGDVVFSGVVDGNNAFIMATAPR
jgi:hypothetical protein